MMVGIVGSALSLAGCGDDDAMACVPGASQACVGVGGCAGGQVCLADGSGFGACECGGSDGGTDGAVDGGVDASSDGALDSTSDSPADSAADADPDSCDPLAGTGCGAGEKCSWRIENDATAEGRTTCVPNGEVARGEACEFLPAVDGGYDDCVAGSWCIDGACAEVCDDADDMCASGTHCIRFATIFEDREDIGACVFSCDVLAQDCPLAGDGCYVLASTGEPSCIPPASETVALGEVCEFPNSCEPGAGCWFQDDTTGMQMCAYHCDADGSGGPACDDSGGPGASFTCVSLQSYYAGLPESIPTRIGMCVDCSGIPSGERGCP